MATALSSLGDRLAGPVLFGAVLTACWIYLVNGAGTGMNVAAMSTWQFPPPLDRPAHTIHWTIAHAATMVLMWWIMMVAMMLPGVGRQAAASGRWPGGLRFCLGYTTAWLPFSVAATAVQAILERMGFVDGMTMWSASSGLSSLLLAGVGLYQMSDAKARALARCRATTDTNGSAASGLRNAVSCMISSAPLMSLLFVGGVMNIYWIVTLSAVNLAERNLGSSRLFSKGVGVACILAALWVARVSA